MSQEKKKSFWSGASGTVAAVAAMVTALAGVVPLVMSVRNHDEKPAGAAGPTPTASVTPTEATPSPGEGEAPGGPGAAVAPPVIASPGSLDFGKVPPNLGSSTQAVQLVNTGQDPVTVEQLRIVGPAAAAFTISEGTCQEGTELAPDATCDVKVRFAPSGAGSQQATLVVQRTPGEPLQVPLSGTASLL
jgi:centrosomal CEP192-like protein